MRKLIESVWKSPTFMTWASFLTRSLGLLVLLPLVLTHFSAQEVAVFLLFNVLVGLRSLADFGFGFTFVRYIAYCFGGARSLQNIPYSDIRASTGQANPVLLAEVVGTMRQFHRWMALLILMLFASIGTIAISKQINLLPYPSHGWWAWTVVAISIGFSYWANQFSAYLQGLNQVALVRRWEAIFSVLGIATLVVVLLLGGGLFSLVLTNQTWTVLSGIRNWFLARNTYKGWWRYHAPRTGTRDMLLHVWTPAWRTGVGGMMHMGLVQLTGVLYAQLAEGPQLAALLLALRLIAAVSEFSQAPFYSKLPLYSRLYSAGDHSSLARLAGRGMRFSYCAFLMGWIGLGLVGPWLFEIMNTKTAFPPLNLWALMGLAFLLQRFGAMHLSLYSATNHVVQHIADGISGVLYVLGLMFFIGPFGILAVPMSQLVAYLGFYCWFSAMHSYRLIQIGFFRFERLAALPALACGLLYVGLTLGFHA